MTGICGVGAAGAVAHTPEIRLAHLFVGGTMALRLGRTRNLLSLARLRPPIAQGDEVAFCVLRKFG
jgi:hypothetical protein